MKLTDMLVLDDGAAVSAGRETKVHFSGRRFRNRSLRPESLAGLTNVILSVEGNGEVTTFEAASRLALGYENNFALGAMTLGGDPPTQGRIVDREQNQLDGNQEAFLVGDLIIEQGASLDLNGETLSVQQAPTSLDGALRLGEGTASLEPGLVIERPGNLQGPGVALGDVANRGTIRFGSPNEGFDIFEGMLGVRREGQHWRSPGRREFRRTRC